uniref:RNA polymerase subunit sigma-70 n=1 Tax=Meloidogyne hapla TaxID=6305 RepID=A0A1I8B6S7_MELHA
MSLIENNFEEFKRLINGWKMRELKDQLCTNKEITTAHTFASTKQEDYPQHRRIVHSRHTGKY